MTGHRTVLVDADGFRWIPTVSGLWDMIPVPGAYHHYGWTREQVESVWGPVFEVSEPIAS